MSAHTEVVVATLTALRAAQTLPTASLRAVAYQSILGTLGRQELVALAAVLAEGNAFGPDAARVMAGAA